MMGRPRANVKRTMGISITAAGRASQTNPAFSRTRMEPRLFSNGSA